MLIDIAFITVYNTIILLYETTSGHKKKLFIINYVIKLNWTKSISINYIFVGQQVCKQGHTHAKLYRTHVTVVPLFRPIFCALYSPDQTSSRL